MDVFMPKFGSLEGDAEQSHSSWHAWLLWASSSLGRVGCSKTLFVPDGFGEVMSAFQVWG